MQDQVQALATNLDKLAVSDQRFARDLIQQFHRSNRLSERQLYWVNTLTQRASMVKPAAELVNVQKILDMFEAASLKLKRIKIKLMTAQRQPVHFSRAGQFSKYQGQIMITDGRPFGQNKFFGRIDLNGNFLPTMHADESVMALVREFAADPEATAAAYGKLTGGCSFCNHSLSDPRSLAVGYGPVCAENFQLKWG